MGSLKKGREHGAGVEIERAVWGTGVVVNGVREIVGRRGGLRRWGKLAVVIVGI